MSRSRRGRVVIAGGATGGHRAVAEAVAHAVQARGGHPHLLLDRAAHGPPAPWPVTVLPDVALPGGAVSTTWRRLPDRLVRAALRAAWPLRGAQALVTVGGAASAPAALAARLLGVPAAVHEQNAVPGRATSVAARVARHRAAAFPPALPGAHRTPVPVSPAFQASPAPGQRRVLVLGGSGGCPALVRAARGAVAAWAAHGVAGGFQAGAWIDDMPAALAQADLVVTPAGAATLAQAGAVGRACVVWPRPDVVRDHQWANAAHLRHRGAVVVAQDAAALARLVPALLARPAALAALAQALQRWVAGDGAGQLAQWALAQ